MDRLTKLITFILILFVLLVSSGLSMIALGFVLLGIKSVWGMLLGVIG